jgi:hypothetical protein
MKDTVLFSYLLYLMFQSALSCPLIYLTRDNIVHHAHQSDATNAITDHFKRLFQNDV